VRRVSLGAVLVLGLVLAPAVAYAAYRATAANSSNSITSGTLALSDNGTGALFSLSGQQPNAASSTTNTRCIKVTSNGSLTSTVRLYGTTGGTGLDAYAGLTITRGAYSPSEPAFGSCTNFTPDGASHLGMGAGVIYGGSLQDFPDAWSQGVVDPAPSSPESWSQGESHVYKIQVTVADNRTAEGKTATQSFTWEAQSS